MTFKTLVVILAISLGQFSNANSQGNRPQKENGFNTIIFTRVAEPKENAFTLLIPKGWQVNGGIFRVNPLAQGGPAQSIAAKLDFSVKKDADETVMIRWLPDVLFFDARYSPAGQMGLFPVGSNYNGMTVCPLLPAEQFLAQVAFPYAHPNIKNPKILQSRTCSNIASSYQSRVRAIMPQLGFTYDAAIISLTYQQRGKECKEKMFGLVENWGQLGAGMWGNKETILLRAPSGDFPAWERVFSIIINSVRLNPQWIAGEIQGQIKRGEIAIGTQQEVQRIEREIVEHRQKTNAEIHNDMFLTLTDQEEYVNPYTHKIETGSNQWAIRWQNESGDVIYTNDENYRPNQDIRLNRSDYKKSAIRKRFPQ